MGFFSFWSSSTPPQASASAPTEDACPVDPKTRSIWLQQQQLQKAQSSPSFIPRDHPPLPPSSQFATSPTAACSSDTISQSPVAAFAAPIGANLSKERVISSIPRALPSKTLGASSANAETQNPETSGSGNWIYPSETQFVQAVIRKNHGSPNTSPENLAETVSSIIPIHNAVNERAWKHIREWEGRHSTLPPDSSSSISPRTCPPKLLSFRGLGAGPQYDVETPFGVILSYISLLNPTTPLTPRARWKTLLGYQPPFDRHDWVVERCGGEQVEYVIDFYQGKEGNPRPDGKNLSFYLDVRPKLNSAEGIRMRWRKYGETK